MQFFKFTIFCTFSLACRLKIYLVCVFSLGPVNLMLSYTSRIERLSGENLQSLILTDFSSQLQRIFVSRGSRFLSRTVLRCVYWCV